MFETVHTRMGGEAVPVRRVAGLCAAPLEEGQGSDLAVVFETVPNVFSGGVFETCFV